MLINHNPKLYTKLVNNQCLLVPFEPEDGVSILQEPDNAMIIRVGVPANYTPFADLIFDNTMQCMLWGFDIELFLLFCDYIQHFELNNTRAVMPIFIKTDWDSIESDLNSGKFRVAIGGITRNAEREKSQLLSNGYLPVGKSILIRSQNKNLAKFKSLDTILEHDDLIFLTNFGGTNCLYIENILGQQDKLNRLFRAKENNAVHPSLACGCISIDKLVPEDCAKAKSHPLLHNSQIPVDVFITDTIEATIKIKQEPAWKLHCPDPDIPLPNSSSEIVYMFSNINLSDPNCETGNTSQQTEIKNISLLHLFNRFLIDNKNLIDTLKNKYL